MPKYPKIKVKLTGRNGNVFSIMGTVVTALRKARVEHSEIEAFKKEAMAGDYKHLLESIMNWVDVK